MNKSILFFVGMMSILLATLLSAQEERRERRRERPEGSPWMRDGGPGGPPPWMRGDSNDGPPGMRGRPGQGGPGRDDTSRNERMLGMLRAMDRNGNGKLEPDEIPEYRRGFVSMVVSRMGGDPNKTIDLNELARKAAGSGGAPNRSGGSTSVSSRSASTPSAVSSDPMVPYFGEADPAASPVLAFGQKESPPKAASARSASSAPALSQSDQILRSAREIMNKYDKTKSGTLDKDKGEWVSSLPFNPDKADKHRDGRISMSELIDALGGKTGVAGGAAAVSTKQSNAYDRLPVGVPDWFFERDKDRDGQLTMMEYANGQPWNEAIADEFRFLDKNNDGVATVDEVFEVLKQVDEEKRLKEEQAKREKERLRGAGAAPEPAKPGDSKEGTPPGEAKPGEPKPGESKPSEPASAVPPSPAAPSGESGPNWKPSTAPSEIPSTAPYSSGSSRREGGSRPYSRRGRNR